MKATGSAAPSYRLPALQMNDRPSGSKLGIYDLPLASGHDGSVAPFVLARIWVPPGVTTALDKHTVREIWLVQSGTGVVFVDGAASRVSSGDALFYDSNVSHQLHNDGLQTLEIVSIWWKP